VVGGVKMLELFKTWLAKDRDEETTRRYVAYAKKLELEKCYCDYQCLFERALKASSAWEKKTVRLWAKLCWQMRKLSLDDLQALREAAHLPKPPATPPPKVELSLDDLDEIGSKSLKILAMFMYYSGVRLTEALDIVKEKPKPTIFADEYCYVELRRVKGKKRSFYAFSPYEVLEALYNDYKISTNPATVRGYFRRYSIKPKMLRKYHYQVCTRLCNVMVCDFYQGRLTGVSAKHYLDILEASKECYPKLVAGLQGFANKVEDIGSLALEILKLLAQELGKKLRGG